MIKFEIGGRPVDPRNIKNAIEKLLIDRIEQQLRDRIGTIRDPDTGEFPTLVVSGPSLDQITVRVEGSEKMVALVERRLKGDDTEETETMPTEPAETPHVFLSFTWDDKSLAEEIANALMANGIDVWWAPWCIGPGDSLRQKIEEGLEGCTHFVVLLTPNSVGKPWVNQEMDAGLVLKLNEGRKFIALRHELPAGRLPRLLGGMFSPEVRGPDTDITELVNGIFGVTQKPKLGKPPAAVEAARAAKTAYSTAATAVAKVFVERSKTACFGDPQLTFTELGEATGLTAEDVEDALHELKSMVQTSFNRALPKDELFAIFDGYWMEWKPADDALKLAADLVNNEEQAFPRSLSQIAERYGWAPRRLNAAVAYLMNRKLIMESRGIGAGPWISNWIRETAETRRFVRSRS